MEGGGRVEVGERGGQGSGADTDRGQESGREEPEDVKQEKEET